MLVDESATRLRAGNGAFFDADSKQTFGRFEVAGADHTEIARQAVDTVRTRRSLGKRKTTP